MDHFMFFRGIRVVPTTRIQYDVLNVLFAKIKMQCLENVNGVPCTVSEFIGNSHFVQAPVRVCIPKLIIMPWRLYNGVLA
eukprot:scaffold267900_cov21-Tisochrysis_lutea.AAC.1